MTLKKLFFLFLLFPTALLAADNNEEEEKKLEYVCTLEADYEGTILYLYKNASEKYSAEIVGIFSEGPARTAFPLTLKPTRPPELTEILKFSGVGRPPTPDFIPYKKSKKMNKSEKYTIEIHTEYNPIKGTIQSNNFFKKTEMTCSKKSSL